MTTQYSRNVLKMVVAQICQTIGWHSINSTPLEFMVDLMQEYIFQLSKLTQQYTQVLGRSDANLDDLGLAFRHMNINLQELAEYVKNVDSVPCVVAVPKLPIHKESHLNFLKPGSREVVTRSVHVHEHLPAMYPATEEEYLPEFKQVENIHTSTVSEPMNISEDDSNEVTNIIAINGVSSEDNIIKSTPPAVFKRPGDPVSFDGSAVKRVKTTEEGRPLREIHSVIMTTSGFLSTAREGKLPESRTPQQTRSESPTPSYPITLPENKMEKKMKKITKRILPGSEDVKPENKENKKKKIPKDTLFKPDEIKDVKVKKLTGMKELTKLKALKQGGKAASPNTAGPSNVAGKVQGKISGGSPKHIKNIPTINKVKVERVIDVTQNTENISLNERKEEVVDKLPIEPDKQKLNIFKKISSKPKEDKEKEVIDLQHKLKDHACSDNSPSLIISDNERNRNDILVKQEDKKSILQSPLANNCAARATVTDDGVVDMMSPGSDVYMFDDMSPPGTPSTPKTPELNVPNVTMEQKKKRKEKTGKKKETKLKSLKNTVSPKKARLSNDSVEVNVMDRPKTPQAPEQPPPPRDTSLPPSLPFPFFPPFPAAPGLIPHPMFPLPLHKALPGMVGPPNPAAVMPGMLRQRFFRPKIEPSKSIASPSLIGESLRPSASPVSSTLSLKQQQQLPVDKPRPLKSPEKELMLSSPKLPTSTNYLVPDTLVSSPILTSSGGSLMTPLIPPAISPVVPAPLLPPNLPLVKSFKPDKVEKIDKIDKKSKEHKKEKKDKLKKKKEKKEKHKDKGEKIKEKKDKSEKKEKLEKIKEKKEKKEKRKEKEANKKIAKEEKILESVPKITLKLGPAGGSPRPPTPDSALTKKITIKPPKKPEEEVKREPTPELARISALVTRPPKQKSTKAKAEAVPKKEDTKEDKENGGNTLTSKSTVTVDQSGRQVWICPACGKQDDGSPMIGCDDCDAWYHWVCVGIQVAPADNEDWYCRLCIAKKQEQYHDKKKKKRKKKVKVNA
ncbi:PREDICTED: transcription initiation factor TFIID subunit 3 isoform X2 [Ceratosolen solmsi marchali]|uniref:Transcription initiation factor TFIID subunit 3 isoform X2 n=1 Tax=Ceratosolen solmsi marchali TaxID=326594 RepID=A0AAJ6YF04_9HYME|nr:PREDICTED: transcription initiation factor TFIID subunit 3 isoform X2 [Ceratosolen solmsi marchali]